MLPAFLVAYLILLSPQERSLVISLESAEHSIGCLNSSLVVIPTIFRPGSRVTCIKSLIFCRGLPQKIGLNLIC